MKMSHSDALRPGTKDWCNSSVSAYSMARSHAAVAPPATMSMPVSRISRSTSGRVEEQGAGRNGMIDFERTFA